MMLLNKDELSHNTQSETLIVIPTYNESLNIEKMMNRIMELYPEIHLLIVDDNSPDKTYELVQEKQKEFKNIHLLKRKYKDGIANAYIAGFKYAIENKYKYVVQMDCDFSHDPQDIKSLVRELSNSDLAIGSRYINGIRVINWPLKRLIISYLGSIYIRLITSLPVIDCTGGFKAIKTEVLDKINLNEIISTGYIFQTEITYKSWLLNFKIKEVPIIFYERTFGESKLHHSIMTEGLINVIKLKIQSLKK